ncbi:FCD domain-containing protein [Seonamhaeicola sp. MEBiC1930]|uniref:FadR/GntR family transcriptional regulator n=1 Tax=Seonamhaeicola sp. MEBiC01930 TaxID=2976768 RepID=UPI0032453E62
MKSKPVRIKDNIEVHNMLISQIKNYINLRNLRSGDKLPSERVLSEQFKVSRRNVREAIEKLEFYGLVKSVAQTGTFISDIGHIAMVGIIDEIVGLDEQDFVSLVETRLMLEEKAVYLAAKRRTEEDLENIETAFNIYKKKILGGEDALQEDILFHLAIFKASKNPTINALMLQIAPKILSFFGKTRVADEEGFIFEVERHQAILDAIRDKNPKEAVRRMEIHFDLLIKFCHDYK